jgi:hypothetical protein
MLSSLDHSFFLMLEPIRSELQYSTSHQSRLVKKICKFMLSSLDMLEPIRSELQYSTSHQSRFV